MELTGDGAPAVEEPAVPVQMVAGVEQGPDGTPWVRMQLALGLTVFTMLVPEKTARDIATLLPPVLVEQADNARRARSGLVIASNGHQVPLPPIEQLLRRP